MSISIRLPKSKSHCVSSPNEDSWQNTSDWWIHLNACGHKALIQDRGHCGHVECVSYPRPWQPSLLETSLCSSPSSRSLSSAVNESGSSTFCKGEGGGEGTRCLGVRMGCLKIGLHHLHQGFSNKSCTVPAPPLDIIWGLCSPNTPWPFHLLLNLYLTVWQHLLSVFVSHVRHHQVTLLLQQK